MPAKAFIADGLKYDNNGLDLVLTSVREYCVWLDFSSSEPAGRQRYGNVARFVGRL